MVGMGANADWAGPKALNADCTAVAAVAAAVAAELAAKAGTALSSFCRLADWPDACTANTGAIAAATPAVAEGCVACGTAIPAALRWMADIFVLRTPA